MSQALLQALRWIAQRFPKLVEFGVKQWSTRPSFAVHPASRLEGATPPLAQGAVREALASVVGTTGNLTAWRDTVDLLLADLGEGDLDAARLERLRHACDALYEEGMTTSWQYLAKGRLRGLERRLWVRSVQGAEAMLVCSLGPRRSSHWIAELRANGSGPVAAGAANCRAQWFRWLAQRPRPLLSQRAVAGEAEFHLVVDAHRSVLKSLVRSERLTRLKRAGLYAAPVLTAALAFATAWFLGSQQGGRQAQRQALVEGLPSLENLLRDPATAEELIRELAWSSGAGPSRMLYQPADALSILLASGGDLSRAASRAKGAQAELAGRRCGNEPVCQALVGAFRSSTPLSTSHPPSEANQSRQVSVPHPDLAIDQLACLEHRAAMGSSELCNASDDEVFGRFQRCRVSERLYETLQTWSGAAITSQLRFTELKLALRRIACTRPRMPPAALLELPLESLTVPDDECGAPNSYGLEALSRAGEIAGLAPRDTATLRRLDEAGRSFVEALYRWSGQALIAVAGQESEPPDGCLERLAEEPTGQRAAAVISWLAAMEPNGELAKGAQRAARRILEAPMDWRTSTREQAAGRSPMVFLAAARFLQVGTEAAWPGLMRESRCGFHCLAAIATVSCDQARGRQGSEYRPGGLSLAALTDPLCAEAWGVQDSPAPTRPGGLQADKES